MADGGTLLRCFTGNCNGGSNPPLSVRFKSEKAGIAYQTMIKKLMTDWLAHP